MLTTEDLQSIQDIVKKTVKVEVSSSEKRIISTLTAKIDQARDDLRQEIGDYMSEVLMPIIDTKADKSELERVKLHVGMS